MFHVLTEEAAKRLGILDSNGHDQPHSATLAQVAAAAESAHETFGEARDAAFETGAERWVIDGDGDSSWIRGPQKYTFTIFDAAPNTSSGTAWDTHTDVELTAAFDADAVREVREVMASEAAGLSTADGYEVGDAIHAIVWSEDGTIVGQPTYELTAADLGVASSEDETGEYGGVFAERGPVDG